jgi:riboflavin-specific deaminase-like protein
MAATPATSTAGEPDVIETAWTIVLATSAAAEAAATDERPCTFAMSGDELTAVADDDPQAVVAWKPGSGWEARLSPTDPRRPLVELYLPVTSASSKRPLTVGHLGQSLDGFIATHAGESQFVTGEENILHLHRMRALCDAVVVGAGTVAADDPQLTTRKVTGASPLRVVLDPSRRLDGRYKVFVDELAETLYICTQGRVGRGETHIGRAQIATVDESSGGLAVEAVVTLLRNRGCHRIFVEGGGVTVSKFLEADLLDRLQVAIAPLIIGDGRAAIRLPPRRALSECLRPRHRVFRMGSDVFFDCDLRAGSGAEAGAADLPLIGRVI